MNKTNTSSPTKESKSEIQFLLSRSIYSLGSPILGSIYIPSSDKGYRSIQLYVAGRARVDPRWHDTYSFSRFGTHPHHRELPNGVEETAVDCYFGRRRRRHSVSTVEKDGGSIPCICFWSTNSIKLYDEGQVTVQVVKGYDHEKSNPLLMKGSWWFKWGEQFVKSMREENNDGEGDNDAVSQIEGDQVLYDSDVDLHDSNCSERHSEDTQELPTEGFYFTFRTDLPEDLPPSANATCVRYFYSAVLVVQTMDKKVIVFQAPFTVAASPLPKVKLENSANATADFPPSQTKIRVGTIYAINHKTPFPLRISPTSEIEPSRVCVHPNNCGWDTQNVRTIPLEDHGHKCCFLTIVGGKVMYPGDKILLQFDFLGKEDFSNNVAQLRLPCHQVSACLYGEEKAIGIDGITKTRTRYNVFDTGSIEVEHGFTESVSLSLLLPLDCPVTLKTDLVEATLSCRIDVTVCNVGTLSEEDQDDSHETAIDSKDYKFLTVEFPCQVVQHGTENHSCEGELTTMLQSKIMHLATMKKTEENFHASDRILNSDALNDLTMLALHKIQTTVT